MKQAELIKQEVLDNEYATLWYYPQLKVVHHKFHKFIYGDKFREVLTAGADIFEQYGCNKWLSDDRKNSALSNEDAEWGAKAWNPRVLNSGWKYWAMILPDKTVGKMNMKRLISAYDGLGLRIEIFEDEHSALVWLSSLD